uniref:Uncharacterized protein n=1 Tax=Ditylum brightwellii TaxID=49249 RepID=A0A7S1YP60_9STRA|mmetsp:Transcript_11189/g.16667  ORF Transcript_11189/g.16667 Transcript_11189/m.16667 type:complete len:401 (+) Transcript_11189:50-1252(+)
MKDTPATLEVVSASPNQEQQNDTPTSSLNEKSKQSSSYNSDEDEENQTKIQFGKIPHENHKSDNNSLRWSAGQAISSFSDIINDNIIAARYGTMATVTLLVLYGVSKTPVFFRYRTVSEIPSNYFADRKRLYGRIVHIAQRDSVTTAYNRSTVVSSSASSIGADGTSTTIKDAEIEKPIVCYIRHLSPVGRLLNRTAFEFAMKHSPRNKLLLEEKGGLFHESDLLKVEIAGIKTPPHYNCPNHMEQEGEWLRRLAENRTYVSCQLLSRRTTMTNNDNNMNDSAAICHIQYRPPGLSLFRTDLAESLVRFGRASVSSSGMHIQDATNTTKTVDGSTNIDTIRSDASYMDKLSKAEFEAVKKMVGMWSDEFVRMERPDLVEEAKFEATAGVLQRLWRWLRKN